MPCHYRSTFIAMLLSLLSNPLTAADVSPLNHYLTLAHQENSAFSSFSSERGRQLFYQLNEYNQKLPGCSSCHGKSPRQPGQTQSGKRIEPMAISVNTTRYSNLKKTEKWFRRNCKSVLGRTCSTVEKGDFITFMMNQ